MNSMQVTVVSHTHWDRAWYVPFQEFRARLVRLVDRLVHLLENDPDFRVFMLDGQMAVLEDYLEVRPQRRQVLEQLCQSGRLKVGPWYVLADEFLVSPEALIRNLQLGHRLGEAYGGVSRLGYVPDGFGHIAQLPQILRGFGIDNAFFWRGLGAEGERLGTEFSWKAADGSAVTTIWMPFGYHNLSNLGYPIHWGDTSQMEFDPELALEQIQRALQALQPMANTGTLLLMNGIDHEEAEPRLPEILCLAQDLFPAYTFTHGTLDEHLAQVRAALGTKPLPEFSGEFRWGKYSEILQGVYATRMHLKQENFRIETLLERYSEPLAALAQWSGAVVPEGTQDLLWTGWRWLLQNHPHDDIYGSGVDQVYVEMMYRFSQAEQIGQLLVRDSLRQLARQVDFTGQPGLPLLVYNPLGWERQETVTGVIDFEFDDPTAEHFRLVDSSGQPAPVQVLHAEEALWMETLKANRKRRVRVAFPAKLPACGYAAYYVQPAAPGDPAEVPAETEAQAGSVAVPGLVIRPDGAENAYLAFCIAADGGVDVTDKASGATYSGLAHFEDVEDAGDEYSFCPFPDSTPLSTRGQPAQVRQLVAGPELVTFEISRSWQIPAALAPDRRRRAEATVTLPLVSRLTLYRQAPGLYIETEVDNRAQDHKLSAVFPTGLNPELVHVDQPFLVQPRPVDLPASPGWVEDPTPLMHQRAFTDISQAGRGLAIFNRGLPAVEVTRQPGGVQLALTLLRCTGWLSRADLWTRRVAAGPLVESPGGQCPGHYRFEYAIFPHAGDWRAVYQAAYNYAAPLLLARADTHEGLDLREMNLDNQDPSLVRPIAWPRGGPLPPLLSFVAVDRPELVLSSLHQARESGNLIVRYYNITGEPLGALAGAPTSLISSRPLAAAWQVNLNEERQQQLPLQDAHTLPLSVGAHQVITLELVPLSG